MVRRITGITGISLWLVLIAAVAMQLKANGEEIFNNLPEGWQVVSSFSATEEQKQAISQKLGAKITKLTNTIISTEGKNLQVNVIYCSTTADAEKIYENILKEHNGLLASAVLDDNRVIEFAKTNDVELMNKAREALELDDSRLNALDAVTRKVIKKIPDGWVIEKSFVVPQSQAIEISKKLGGRIKALSNMFFSVEGKKFQVNVIEAATAKGAEKIYESISAMKNDPAFRLKIDNFVIEFVSGDIELAKNAPKLLGIAEQTTKRSNEEDINAKVARININRSTIKDVVRVFGKPLKYVWGQESFEKNNLPETYIADYPDGFSVVVSENAVVELRHYQPGYAFQGKLQVGDSLEKAVEVLGEPEKTVENQPNKFENGVLYKDINGRKGDCYYGQRDKGVRLFLTDYKINELYVTKDDLSGRRKAITKQKTTPGAASIQTDEFETMAKNFVKLLADRNFEQAATEFDVTMKNVLPAEKLKEAWDSVITGAGQFVEQVGVRKEKVLAYKAVFVTCRFERTKLDAKIVFDREKRIAGLFFVPTKD